MRKPEARIFALELIVKDLTVALSSEIAKSYGKDEKKVLSAIQTEIHYIERRIFRLKSKFIDMR